MVLFDVVMQRAGFYEGKFLANIELFLLCLNIE
ncbi:MAG: hypothetical protein QG653_278 [Patescibacteria group bacterium]|nr:hypothetical protein [Patescibacteria group bacterium]